MDTDELDSHVDNMEEEIIEFFLGEETIEVDEFDYEWSPKGYNALYLLSSSSAGTVIREIVWIERGAIEHITLSRGSVI